MGEKENNNQTTTSVAALLSFIQRARARQHPETNTPLFLHYSSALFCYLVLLSR